MEEWPAQFVSRSLFRFPLSLQAKISAKLRANRDAKRAAQGLPPLTEVRRGCWNRIDAARVCVASS